MYINYMTDLISNNEAKHVTDLESETEPEEIIIEIRLV